MEDILDVYCRPYDEKFPIVCMDEQPRQLIGEARPSLCPAPGRVAREDFEYVRNGTVSIFLFTEPLGNWRKVNVRKRRTKLDWAHEMRELLDKDYPDAEKVILICDNLNTHKTGSLYEAFAPEEARRFARRLEIHYTPKHGSWLNIAEIELSAMTKQCLERRIPSMVALCYEVKKWEEERNRTQTGVDWRFRTEDARIKLKRLYPEIQLS
jgi:hypothetical protein